MRCINHPVYYSFSFLLELSNKFSVIGNGWQRVEESFIFISIDRFLQSEPTEPQVKGSHMIEYYRLWRSPYIPHCAKSLQVPYVICGTV
jgi:hypothetical protein